jgi:AcrR family transcriptional regulator
MMEPGQIAEGLDELLPGRMRAAADAARRVIIRKGLEATTLRDIAREGGFTTGVLMHYFADKRDVIVAAFAETSRLWISYAREEMARAQTLQELIAAFLRVAIPAEEEGQAEWRLWAEMWVYAGRDHDFAEQVEATDAVWTGIVRTMLERCRDEGRLRPGVDIYLEAEILNRLMDGLGLRAWLSRDWELPRTCLEGHLCTLGLAREVAAARADGASGAKSRQEEGRE